MYTGLVWYAQYPNHYAGDGKDATPALGELSFEWRSNQLAEVIKAVKADTEMLRLQKEFFKDSASPLHTKVKE